MKMKIKTNTITLNIHNPKWLSDYVTVGDIILGKPVTEIWVSSTGSAMFVIGGEDYTFEELKEALSKDKVEKERCDKINKDLDQDYDEWKQRQIDRGETV